MCQVVLLTVDVVVELVVGSLYHNAAHAASSLGLLEMLLTYWFVLKEQVGVSQRLIAHMALKERSEGGRRETGSPSCRRGGRTSCCSPRSPRLSSACRRSTAPGCSGTQGGILERSHSRDTGHYLETFSTVSIVIFRVEFAI